METDKNYVNVGIFVILTITAIIAFSLWLAGPHDKSKYTPYRIRFSESVSGLNVGGAVKFRGVDVGKVESIAIDPTDSRRIRVDVNILKTTPIKTDTVASLKLQGVTGVVFVELTGGMPEAPSLASNDNEDIPEIPAEQSSITAIVNIMPEILQKVSAIAAQLNKLVSDENVASIHNTLVAFEKLSTSLERQTGQMEALLVNSNATASDIHEIVQSSKSDVKDLLKSLNATSEQLNAFIKRTNEASGGQYQEFYQLINELKSTTREINSFTRSLQENPSRVIFPRQEKGIPAP